MDKFDCMRCIHALYEPEYHIPFGNDDISVEMFLCDNADIKDMYYNGTGKTRVSKTQEIDITKQSPVPIGEVCWTCRGKFYVEDTEQTMYDIL